MQHVSTPIPPPQTVWKPGLLAPACTYAALPMVTALRRGVIGRCPACGQGKIFAGFLRVVPACGTCAAPLGDIRADDAPPYFTVFIVAHVIIGLLVWFEHEYTLTVATEMTMFLPATLALTLALIRPVKGRPSAPC